MNIERAKEIDLVNYLASIGHHPVKIKEPGYWYKSPLREEKSASFKVNRKMNKWFDFGDGRHGNIIDFGTLFHKCSVSEFLRQIDSASLSSVLSIHVQKPMPPAENRIEILSEIPISSYPLLHYLDSRKINEEVAKKYCKELKYKVGERSYFAIGFKNNAGGFELRNKHFKGSSSPKDVTVIQNGSQSLVVFEGFFNFLSYLSTAPKPDEKADNFLILNSASFFERSIPLMIEYKSVHLYLDNDATGQSCSQKVLNLDANKFHDQRQLYRNHNDLNSWLIHSNITHKSALTQKP